MPTGVVVGQLVVVESQKIQPGDVDATDMVDALHGLGPDLIGGPNGMPGLGSTSGKPHGHGLGIMVSSIAGASAPDSIVRGTTELTAPNHQGVFEQTAFLEVAEQSGDGLVDGADE